MCTGVWFQFLDLSQKKSSEWNGIGDQKIERSYVPSQMKCIYTGNRFSCHGWSWSSSGRILPAMAHPMTTSQSCWSWWWCCSPAAWKRFWLVTKIATRAEKMAGSGCSDGWRLPAGQTKRPKAMGYHRPGMVPHWLSLRFWWTADWWWWAEEAGWTGMLPACRAGCTGWPRGLRPRRGSWAHRTGPWLLRRACGSGSLAWAGRREMIEISNDCLYTEILFLVVDYN